MLAIQGAIQIIPESVSCEPGKLKVGEESKGAVVITYITTSGPVQIVLPSEHVDSIADGMKSAKQEADNESADLYIPSGGMAEAEQIAKGAEEIQNIAKG